MYAEYQDYEEKFFGSQIPDAAAFRYPAARASEYMDMVTFSRLSQGVPEEYAYAVCKCCCALAEAIYQYHSGYAGSEGSGPGKASESIGKYSVTYRTENDTLAALLHGDTAGLQDYLHSLCMRYLGDTGLMYRGGVTSVYE